MLPRLFHIGNFGLPTYGLMAALGLIFGLMLIVKLGREQGLDPDKLWNLGIIAILSGIVGAKLLMILVDLGYYREHTGRYLQPVDVAGGWGVVRRIRAGADHVHLVHASQQPARAAHVRCVRPRSGAGPRLRTRWLLRRRMLLGPRDPRAVGRDLSQSAGQGVVGTPLNVPLHPTQLYEMVVELCNCVFLVWLLRRKKFEGEIIGTYMIIYGVAAISSSSSAAIPVVASSWDSCLERRQSRCAW